VAATGAEQSAGGTLAVAEKAKLRKVLGRMDLVLFTACAIVGLDSVAAAAEAAAQAITWLVISLVLFLIPYGMITAELGSAFPVEGGPYEWARMAFGRPAGAEPSQHIDRKTLRDHEAAGGQRITGSDHQIGSGKIASCSRSCPDRDTPFPG